MEVSVDTSTNKTCLHVLGDMTIQHVAESKEQFFKGLGLRDQIDLDLLMVSEIDTAGLQLLMVLRNEAEKLGKKVCVAAQSFAVTELMELFGLEDLFSTGPSLDFSMA